ncbi:NPCBM/NEW2 domain-containing protein [Deinococcus sp.]|uniref:NPCBM/NEW2 domain-containing protein n=1 Tax=Deinococcus sp. TaxID=47478 RepID=UPI003B58D409
MNHAALRSSLLLALALTACGQQVTQPPPNATDEATATPWVYTAPEGSLTALSLDAGANSLTFEPLLYATNGWGPFETNRSNGGQAAGDGLPLTLNGVVYAKGFGVHAESKLRYSLLNTKSATCNTFSASVGVDDEVGSQGSAVFQVFVDGVKKYDSGIMTGSSATKNLSVSIAGARTLALKVTDAGDGKAYDHADWVSPMIQCANSAAPAPGSLDAKFTSSGFGTFALTALTAQGQIIGFGHLSVGAGTPRDYFVQRLDQDGNRDYSFASPLLPLSADGDELGVLVQPDGRILILGRASLPIAGQPGLSGDSVLFVRRLFASGQPDSSFGTGSGTFAGVQFVSEVGQTNALAQQPGGQIVIGGTAPGGGFLMRRLLSGGQPDASFGLGGSVITTFAGGVAGGLLTLTAQPDGRLLAGGRDFYSATAEYRAVVARYSAGGTLDASFSGDGWLELGRQKFQAKTDAIRVLPGGQILVASEFFGTTGQFASLRRLNSNGAIDASYSGFSAGNFKANAVGGLSLALQADGRAVLGGARFGDAGDGSLALFRFNVDGTLDTSFGSATDQLGNTGASVPDSGNVLIQPASVGGKIISGFSTLSRVWP